MSIYSDKLAHVQVIINYRYSVSHMCTREDTLAHILGAPYVDDFMIYKLAHNNSKLIVHVEIIWVLD